MPDLLKTMFDAFHCVYYAILLCASVLSYLSYKKGNHKYLILLILFVTTILFELLTSFLSAKHNQKHEYIFTMFNAFEYDVLTVYYIKTSNNALMRKLAKLSAVLFTLNSLVFTILVMYSLKENGKLIVLNIQIEVMLLLIIYTHLLFNIDDDLATPIYKHHDFWTSIGVLVFYSGIFWLLGLYPILSNINQETAYAAYGSIMNPLNVFLYVSISVGIICTLWKKEYTAR